MKVVVTVLCLAIATSALPDFFAAEKCSQEVNCVGTDGCRCSAKKTPLTNGDTPQFITLAFNDAVTQAIYNEHLEPLLFNRINPDNNKISATFYVPHEYTDYEKVNALYKHGFEIAVHSISKSPLSEYWQQADVDLLYDEFHGQREILSAFANIPIDEVVGARTPNLELNGDVTFAAYQRSGIQYDNSWTSFSSNRYFPYTLDFSSDQPCLIGTCPTESFPGTWVLPIVDITGTNGNECNSLLGCVIEAESHTEVTEWLIKQFNKHYIGNRAPLTLTVNSAWFSTSPHHKQGFIDFLDQLAAHQDVFLVSHKQLMDWAKSPVPVEDYVTSTTDREAECEARTCPLMKDEEMRYMMSCTDCPSLYPWVGNPFGEDPPEPTEEPTEEPEEPTEEPEEPTEESEALIEEVLE